MINQVSSGGLTKDAMRKRKQNLNWARTNHQWMKTKR